mmetsp:Transcript_9165/g.15737  ORF Transcript_9165/g.15737 Transcript_9165/m.15737 type:complete len:494 (+) Transcript_9165:564-2045(+)
MDAARSVAREHIADQPHRAKVHDRRSTHVRSDIDATHGVVSDLVVLEAGAAAVQRDALLTVRADDALTHLQRREKAGIARFHHDAVASIFGDVAAHEPEFTAGHHHSTVVPKLPAVADEAILKQPIASSVPNHGGLRLTAGHLAIIHLEAGSPSGFDGHTDIVSEGAVPALKARVVVEQHAGGRALRHVALAHADGGAKVSPDDRSCGGFQRALLDGHAGAIRACNAVHGSLARAVHLKRQVLQSEACRGKGCRNEETVAHVSNQSGIAFSYDLKRESDHIARTSLLVFPAAHDDCRWLLRVADGHLADSRGQVEIVACTLVVHDDDRLLELHVFPTGQLCRLAANCAWLCRRWSFRGWLGARVPELSGRGFLQLRLLRLRSWRVPTVRSLVKPFNHLRIALHHRNATRPAVVSHALGHRTVHLAVEPKDALLGVDVSKDPRRDASERGRNLMVRSHVAHEKLHEGDVVKSTLVGRVHARGGEQREHTRSMLA